MKRFIAPKDKNGKRLWVPIVVKNKDYLLGYIESCRVAYDNYELPLNKCLLSLGSDRFNDTMMNDKKPNEMSKDELTELVTDMIDESVTLDPDYADNDSSIYYDNQLVVECPECRMVEIFKTDEEVPEEDFSCLSCGRKLIIYTNSSDSEFVYEGNAELVTNSINGVITDLFANGLSDENDEEEDDI
jgi:hypothetical protein